MLAHVGAVTWAAGHDGPVFIRVSRMGVPAVNASDYAFAPGRAHELRRGSDVTIVATGTVVSRVLASLRVPMLIVQGVEGAVD